MWRSTARGSRRAAYATGIDTRRIVCERGKLEFCGASMSDLVEYRYSGYEVVNQLDGETIQSKVPRSNNEVRGLSGCTDCAARTSSRTWHPRRAKIAIRQAKAQRGCRPIWWVGPTDRKAGGW